MKNELKKPPQMAIIVFALLTTVIFVSILAFIVAKILFNPNEDIKNRVETYLNNKYEPYKEYARINNIKLISKGNKVKEGCNGICFGQKDKNIKEYIFQYEATYLDYTTNSWENDEKFYVTFWANTEDNTTTIRETDGTQPVLGFKTYIILEPTAEYNYTGLWIKICPKFIKEIIYDAIDKDHTYEIQITPAKDNNSFNVLIPVNILSEYYNNKERYEELFKKLDKFYEDTRSFNVKFYIDFLDVKKIEVQRIYSDYKEFGDYIERRLYY